MGHQPPHHAEELRPAPRHGRLVPAATIPTSTRSSSTTACPLTTSSALTSASPASPSRSSSHSCNAVVQHWRTLSVAAGRPWIIANDEQGPANFALPPDDIDPAHDLSRQGSLWGALLAGAWGNEWYFGYKHPHSDLSCQDWRTRDKFWDQARHALDFFGKNKIPFWRMNPANELLSHRDGYCLALPGDTYVIFLKSGGTKTVLNLGTAGGLYTGLGKERFLGTYEVRWFDPRNGGDLRSGSITTITNTGNTGDDGDGATNNSARQFLGFSRPPTPTATG